MSTGRTRTNDSATNSFMADITTAEILTTDLTGIGSVETTGHTAANDGGAALWVATGNTGTPVSTSYEVGKIYDSVGNEFEIDARPGIDPVAFGADPTGVVVATQLIQDAVDAINARGCGTVRMQAGTYQVDGKVTIPTNTTGGIRIVGEGRDCTIITTSHATEAVFYAAAGSGQNFQCSIENMSITADTQTTRTGGYMIELLNRWRGCDFKLLNITAHINAMLLGRFEIINMQQCWMHYPGSVAGGITLTLGDQSGGTEGSAIDIRDCFFQGNALGYLGIGTNTVYGNVGIALYDVDAVFMYNNNVAGYLEHAMELDPTRLCSNHKFIGNSFEATTNDAVINMHSTTQNPVTPGDPAIIRSINFDSNWIASAGINDVAGTSDAAGLLMSTRSTPLSVGAGLLTNPSSNTAAITHVGHGYSPGDQISIEGAAEEFYDGEFTVATAPTADTLTFFLNGIPSASPATGTITMFKGGAAFSNISFSNDHFQSCDGPGVTLKGPNDTMFFGCSMFDNGNKASTPSEFSYGVHLDTGIITGPTFESCKYQNGAAAGDIFLMPNATAASFSGGISNSAAPVTFSTDMLSFMSKQFSNLSMPSLVTDFAVVAATELQIPPTERTINITNDVALADIQPTYDGHIVTIVFDVTPATVSIDSGAGNIRANGDFTAGAAQSTITLRCDSQFWFEVGRSDYIA